MMTGGCVTFKLRNRLECNRQERKTDNGENKRKQNGGYAG